MLINGFLERLQDQVLALFCTRLRPRFFLPCVLSWKLSRCLAAGPHPRPTRVHLPAPPLWSVAPLCQTLRTTTTH